MATANLQGINPLPLLAGGAIDVARAVYISAANTVVVTSAITQHAIGCSLETVASGAPVRVQTSGVAKCTASAAISAGALVMPTGSGAGKCVTASGATAVAFGIALTAAGADGDVLEVLLLPTVKAPANS